MKTHLITSGHDWRNGRVTVTLQEAPPQKEQIMKTHVTIDGVTLSRAQVEAAYKELNAPTQPPFKVGDLVRAAHHVGFVVQVGPGPQNDVAKRLSMPYGDLKDGWIRIVTREGTSWSGKAVDGTVEVERLSELKA